MMAVPSIRPTTINALRPGRRRTLRIPSRRKTRLRSASAAVAPSATMRMPTRTTANVLTGMPNSRLTVLSSSPDGTLRRVGDIDVVGLTSGCRPNERHELLDLRAVAAARDAFGGRISVGPEGDYDGLALWRGEDVAALVTRLRLQLRQDGLLESLDSTPDAHPDAVDLSQRHPRDHFAPPALPRRRSRRPPSARCGRSNGPHG